MIDEKQLAEWEDLAEKATEGDWEMSDTPYQFDEKGRPLEIGVFDGIDHDENGYFINSKNQYLIATFPPDFELDDEYKKARNDAFLLVLAKVAMPMLIAEVRRLQSENKWLMTQAGKEVSVSTKPMPDDVKEIINSEMSQ
jgi:hypothetical protein